MKILITGSSGFVGKHLVKKLLLAHKVIEYDIKNGLDVLNEKELLKKLKGVDLVIHLAAFISATESWNKPSEYFKNNALGTLSVVRNSVKSKVGRLIFFSSAAVKNTPKTPYAVSKICAEEILSLYLEKINTVIVRPENIYGPGQKNYAQVIHNFINAVKKGVSIKIYGDGTQTRDFIFIDDVVFFVENLLKFKNKSGSIINIGTGNPVRINILAHKIMKIMNKKVSIKYLPPRNEPKESLSEKKRKDFISVDEGIKKLLKK